MYYHYLLLPVQQVCYHSYNTLLLTDCIADCSIINGQLDSNCASKWGRCLRRAYIRTYTQVHNRVYHIFPYSISHLFHYRFSSVRGFQVTSTVGDIPAIKHLITYAMTLVVVVVVSLCS